MFLVPIVLFLLIVIFSLPYKFSFFGIISNSWDPISWFSIKAGIGELYLGKCLIPELKQALVNNTWASA